MMFGDDRFTEAEIGDDAAERVVVAAVLADLCALAGVPCPVEVEQSLDAA